MPLLFAAQCCPTLSPSLFPPPTPPFYSNTLFGTNFGERGEEKLSPVTDSPVARGGEGRKTHTNEIATTRLSLLSPPPTGPPLSLSLLWWPVGRYSCSRTLCAKKNIPSTHSSNVLFFIAHLLQCGKKKYFLFRFIRCKSAAYTEEEEIFILVAKNTITLKVVGGWGVEGARKRTYSDQSIA